MKKKELQKPTEQEIINHYNITKARHLDLKKLLTQSFTKKIESS